MAVDDASLEELYFRTTLELRDDSGQLYRITPTQLDDQPSDADVVLRPFSDAFILTAENPESLGEFSAQQNAEATELLHQRLLESSAVFRDCPGYAFDSDHVEPGFAVLSHSYEANELQQWVVGLAKEFRQNAIFHLGRDGLSLIGVLRPDLRGTRPVLVERV